MVRLTVAEAALKLGISEAGVRKRVQRNQIPHERGDDGRLRVWVSPGEARHAASRDTPEESRDAPPQSESNTLISEMRDRIRFLEEEVQRKDAILLNMTEAMKALSPPTQETSEATEARESPETVDEQQGRGQPRSDAPGAQETVQRPWWRRVFGG